MTFTELGLSPTLLAALETLGYQQPTPIQQKAIPIVLAGRDLLASAQTGTGKTAGFALPILQGLAPMANSSASPARHLIRALVLLPTRELAIQVYDSFMAYNQQSELRIACVYGGVDIQPQTDQLRKGVEILIATPGRLLDHFEQKNIFLNQISYLVLDEADRMLDMGFLPDIKRIMALLPKQRQTMLFSATFSSDIRKLADSLLSNPETVEVAQANSIASTISHKVYLVHEDRKSAGLSQLLSENPDTQVLVFVDTKVGCDRLSRRLLREGFRVAAIHGDKDQKDRQETLMAFRESKVLVLVATDVAARGLDIDSLPLVINYTLPMNPEDYIHRVGRTGRSGNKGTAISLVTPDEERKLKDIETLIAKPIEKDSLVIMDVHPKRGHRVRQEEKPHRSIAEFDKAPYIGKVTLDFNVNQPFVCQSAEFPQTRKYQKKKASKRPLSALLGGKNK